MEASLDRQYTLCDICDKACKVAYWVSWINLKSACPWSGCILGVEEAM
jgi:hypothetical protein